MNQILVLLLIIFTIISCKRNNDLEQPSGFYRTGCIDADVKVKRLPKDLIKLVRNEISEKIKNDSILGKIPFTVSHPVNSGNCETIYDQYNVYAEVNLISGAETWNLSFKKRANGKLVCTWCNKV